MAFVENHQKRVLYDNFFFMLLVLWLDCVALCCGESSQVIRSVCGLCVLLSFDCLFVSIDTITNGIYVLNILWNGICFKYLMSECSLKYNREFEQNYILQNFHIVNFSILNYHCTCCKK